MNAEVPHCGANQPGATYYMKKWNGYILGCVNSAHVFTDTMHDGKIGHFMNAYLYPEWEGGKGSNVIASLWLMSLRQEGVIKEDERGNPICGGNLTGIADNCGGQNKNITVLRTIAWLVESGYFKEVEMVFLIVGHTKNACDRLFNSMKVNYRNVDVWSFTQLQSVLNHSYNIAVHPVKNNHFNDWESQHDIYYQKIKDHINNRAVIKDSHIFNVSLSNITTDNKNKKHVVMKVREADLPESAPISIELKKLGANNTILPNSTKPSVLSQPGRNPKKVLEFWNKWRVFIPHPFHPEMCIEPSQEQVVRIGHDSLGQVEGSYK
jgi:hypothetical protein